MMKGNLIFILLIILQILPNDVFGTEYSEKIINKAKKIAEKTWTDSGNKDISAIKPEALDSNPESSYFSANDTMFRMINGSEDTLGYLIISAAKGRFELFDFMILYDLEKRPVEIRILTYRSEYGGQITSRSWLRKLCEINPSLEIQYGHNIDALSGATYSAASLTNEVNRINKLVLEIY